MKVAVISVMGGSPWGGSEELWAAMAREAVHDGHDVAMFVYSWRNIPAQIQDLQHRGIHLFRRRRPFYPYLPNLSRLMGGFGSHFRTLFDYQPDVICISQGSAYDATALKDLIYYLKKMRVPYVAICQLISDLRIPNPVSRKNVIEFFTQAFRVVFVSEQNLKTAERHLAQTLSNALVLRNPVNLQDFTPVVWPSSKTARIASVARLEVAYKGQDTLFEVLGCSPWRDRDWVLQLYGEGPDREYLESLARYNGISDRVEFMGHVQNIRAIWSQNHLLALPSRAEGTPLALVEAMLCGRPAVATDVGGIVEWLVEPQTGFIAEAPTPRSFGAALERAWAMRNDWETIGLQAHHQALAKIDPTPGKSLLNIVLEAAKS